MKILDVDLLQDGLKRNMAMLERLRNETENIERTVSGLVEMDELLKGAGGNAIRDFYAECHQPFLQFFQLFSVTYLQTLQQMESSLQSLEPDPAGYIRQEFLEGELEQGITLIGNLTEALTNEANSIMDSVSDIVALPHLDDSAVQEGVITSKKKRDDTVQKLNEFDYSQTVSLNPVEQDIQTMDTWLTDLEGMFQSGLTGVHFQSSHWGILASRNTLKMELEARTSRIQGDTTLQPKNHDLTTMFYTFLTGAIPLQFGYRGFIQKPNVLYGPSILGFASLPTHSPTKNINENVEHETSELDEIYAAILKSNPELAVDSPSTPQTYSANEPITYEGMRKVLGGNGSGTPDGLFAMGVGLSIAAKKGGEIAVEIAADELFLNDIQTLMDPDASKTDKGIALFSLTPMGKLNKAAEGIEEGKDFLEYVIEAQKKAEKAKDAKKSVGDVEVKGTGDVPEGYYQDTNGKWHRSDGTYASNKEMGLSEPSAITKRLEYMGNTPGKGSKTGREVIERMENENPPKIRTTRDGETEFMASDEKWYPIDQADMAHLTDAVSWWNSTGRYYGAKSSEVREWMLDSNNYVLEHYRLNRSEGAKLNEIYLPPNK